MLVGHLSSGRNVFFKSYDYFWFFILTVDLWVLYVFWVLFLIRCMICKYFIPFHVMSFYSVDSFFGCAEVLKIVCPICLFLLLLPVLLVSYTKIYCLIQCNESFSLFFLLGVLYFQVFCLRYITISNSTLLFIDFLIFLVFPSRIFPLWTSLYVFWFI